MTALNIVEEARAHYAAALSTAEPEDQAVLAAREKELSALLDHYAQLLAKIDFNDFGGSIHEKPHALRVLVFSLLLGALEPVNSADLERLALAAVFHDSRREDDDLDTGHGMRASLHYADWAKSQGLEPDPIVRHALAFHDLDDLLGCGLAVEPQKRLITQLFKDADALDRYRFGLDGLDPSFLRRPSSKRLMHAAQLLNGLHPAA